MSEAAAEATTDSTPAATETVAVEEAQSPIAAGTEPAPVEAPAIDSLVSNDAKWFYSDTSGAEVNGIGDKPDWMLDKYSSVEKQAQAYPEIAKKLGAFTGSPEIFDVAKYADNEMFTSDGDAYKEVTGIMKEMGINQAGYEKLMDWHLGDRATMLEDLQYSPEREREALGDDAAFRINNVDSFMRANMGADDYGVAKDLLTTSESIKLMELMIRTSAPKKLPSEGGTSETGMTADKLSEMRYKKTESGDFRMSIDPEYAKHVDAAWEDFYGTEPHKG